MSAVAKQMDASRRTRSPKSMAKSVLRAYGMATSPMRGMPDFMIVGAKRAASTSLWNYVVRHPNVLPMFPSRQRIKGTSFFSTKFDEGERWYRSHFASGAHRWLRSRVDGVKPLTGEATPYYLFHPLAPGRASALVPEARIVVILRNPIDRAYSHYRERARHGAEALSFEDALDAEPDRLEGEEVRIIGDPGYVSHAHEHLSYVAQGRYAPMLERWFGVYPRDHVLVLLNEDLDRDRDAVLDRLFRFLELPAWRPPALERYNYHPDPAMSPDTRERLARTFAEDNRRLESLIGRNLSGWAS